MEADIPIRGSSQRAPGLPTRLLSDERLAQAVAAGNEHAFTTLFKRYHQQLYRYSRSITGNDEDAQDALQSALTKALVALREGRRNAPVRPWLFRIVHNESISLIRSRGTAQDLPAELAASHAVVDSVEQRERLTLLIADLRELPERQRGALVMRELSGLSHEEIAQALQVSVGAAKQVILEARRSLLEFAEGRAMTCDAIQQILSDADRRSLRSRKVRAHLRDCASCSAFAAAIPDRRADMLALAPALPAAAAVGLLAKLTGASSGHGSGGGMGLVAGTAAKGVGVSVSAKVAAAAGAAVVATATVGAVTVLPRSTPAKPAAVSHTVARSHHPSHPSSANAGAGHGVAIGRGGAHGNGPAGQGSDHGRPHKSHGTSASPAHGRGHAHSGTHGNSAISNGSTHGNPSTHGKSGTHGNSAAHGSSAANSAAHGKNSAANSATHGRSSAAPGHSAISSDVASHRHAQTTHPKSQTVKPSAARLNATTRAVHRRKPVHRALKAKPKTRSKPIRRTKTQQSTRVKATTTTTTTAASVTSTTDLSGSAGQHGNGGTPPGPGGNASANKSTSTP
ncbi:MAG: sigma-70 family RNA polymerase sigma factor [Acidobacteriota bacterium]|nr:sigma-70 family RNA polymerase sigma factor [Acidobacteriota bacterium]